MSNTLRTHQDLADMIRQALPDLIDQEAEDVSQEGDCDLALWDAVETGFRIVLSNGAEFNVRIQTHRAPDEAEDEWPSDEEIGHNDPATYLQNLEHTRAELDGYAYDRR